MDVERNDLWKALIAETDNYLAEYNFAGSADAMDTN